MLSDEVRRRLRELGKKKETAQGQGHETTKEALAGLRNHILREQGRKTGGIPQRRIAPPADTGGALGGEEYHTADGTCLALRLPVEAVAPWGREFWGLLERFAATHRTELGTARADEVIFLDIETAGLSSQPLFLIGLLRADSAGPHVLQLLARDYREEPAVISAALEHLRQACVLITYNGRSFDMPYIKERASYHRLRIDLPKVPHVDLLLHARRNWRGRFADCKLQTLETGALGIVRADDIPGALIPEAYHEFVRSGDARQIHEILHHNRLDLLTLAALTGELLG